MANFSLSFRPDKTFRVLQVADIQDGPNVDADTLNFLEKAIEQSQPDLVVLTGDQIRGYDPAYFDTYQGCRNDQQGQHLRFITRLEYWLRYHSAKAWTPEYVLRQRSDEDRKVASERTYQSVRHSIEQCIAATAKYHIPLAVTYGNHDFQCGISVEDQETIYRSYPYCCNANVDGAWQSGEAGSFAIPIYTADDTETVAMSIALVNSGDYHATKSETDTEQPAGIEEGKAQALVNDIEMQQYRNSWQRLLSQFKQVKRKYSYYWQGLRDGLYYDLHHDHDYGFPSQRALQWLKNLQTHCTKTYGKSVPTMVFQHIPPAEFYDCLTPCSPWTWNAIEGTGDWKGQCYILDPATCIEEESFLGESIGCPNGNCGEMDILREAGGYFALFTGHDHRNSFVSRIQDFDYGYAPTCGFQSYGGNNRQRGVRLFTFHQDNPRQYTTELLTFREIVGKETHHFHNAIIENVLMLNPMQIRNNLRNPRIARKIALVLAGAIGAIWGYARYRRKQQK